MEAEIAWDGGHDKLVLTLDLRWGVATASARVEDADLTCLTDLTSFLTGLFDDDNLAAVAEQTGHLRALEVIAVALEAALVSSIEAANATSKNWNALHYYFHSRVLNRPPLAYRRKDRSWAKAGKANWRPVCRPLTRPIV